jgi:hypothetical protein
LHHAAAQLQINHSNNCHNDHFVADKSILYAKTKITHPIHAEDILAKAFRNKQVLEIEAYLQQLLTRPCSYVFCHQKLSGTPDPTPAQSSHLIFLSTKK